MHLHDDPGGLCICMMTPHNTNPHDTSHTQQQWDEYRQRSQYYMCTPFDPVPGSVKRDTGSVVKFLTDMQVSASSVHAMYAAPNEVYKRALRRLRDGHIDVSSFHVTRAKRHDTSEEIMVLTSHIAASLRFVLDR